MVTNLLLHEIGMRDAQNLEILESTKLQNTIVITKNSGSVDLALHLIAIQQISWITFGNARYQHLQQLLSVI